jgi:hypothetical protein
VNRAKDLARRLDECPLGRAGWREFEDACIEALEWLLVPPLTKPIIQPRTINGTERRDAVFPNRNLVPDTNWGYLHQKLDAELILFEFKNYDSDEIAADEVSQTGGYLRKSMGRLAILCCSKAPIRAAHHKRNTIYSENGQVILFLTRDQLKEMLFIKERGEEPSDLILDLIDRFKLEHE